MPVSTSRRHHVAPSVRAAHAVASWQSGGPIADAAAQIADASAQIAEAAEALIANAAAAAATAVSQNAVAPAA